MPTSLSQGRAPHPLGFGVFLGLWGALGAPEMQVQRGSAEGQCARCVCQVGAACRTDNDGSAAGV